MTYPGYTQTLQLVMPAWMKGTPLEQIWLDNYIVTGDGSLALQAVRQSPAYDEILQGNRREDGSLRYDEQTYFGLIESYEDALLSVNLNPDLFREFFPENIEGLVSPQEFTARVNAIQEQVVMNIPEVADWMMANFNIDATPEALFAMAVDPRVGSAIIERRIAMSEVGAAAAAKNLTIGVTMAERLVQYGTDTLEEAHEMIMEFETIAPVMRILAQRHADPEDDFDLESFTNATIFGDPQAKRTMRRRLAQERASFGPDTALTIRRDEEGSLTGLADIL